MKRRNAESGKLRRPVKRTKITEGMYGNSMLYLKFVLLWATVVMADYMLEFRFEFLWPFWMMLRSVYDSFKYQGLAFSVFFICIALTSDMICFFFIPVQWIFFAASTYVWVQYVWYTADRGVCLPTVVLCCALVAVEGAVRGVRGERAAWLHLDLCRPFAAHCVGYPVVTLGFGVKSYVSHRMRLRRQREVQQENEFYFQLLRQALPETAAVEQTQPSKEGDKSIAIANGSVDKIETEQKHMNGNAVPIKSKKEPKERKTENGSCNHEDLNSIQISAKVANHKDSAVKHLSNGVPNGEIVIEREDEERRRSTDNGEQEKTKGSTKPMTKCEKKDVTLAREERKRSRKERDKDKENHVHDNNKTTDNCKENVVKEKEINTKEILVNKDKEKEREREREQREARECSEELKRIKIELCAARSSEAEAKRALAAACASERQRRAEHQALKQSHLELQQKLSTWRGTERATLERRLGEERRARTTAEQQLQHAQRQNQQRKTSECESEWCRARRTQADAETASLRRELQRARDRTTQLQRELTQTTNQVRSLEARSEQDSGAGRLAAALQLLQERASHLEHSLSAETRIKLDLFSALGEAKRQMEIREGLISQQEKEIEELKAKIAQMLAVMPSDSFVNPSGGGVSKLRLNNRRSPPGSPLDPNASVYTPKSVCSDAV